MLPRKLKRDKKAVSNVIVIVLSLILIVVIVSNVILWSYEMNQYDWERMHEDLAITDVYSLNATYSEWFPTQTEYQVNIGSRQSGSYIDTQAVDGTWETFQEEDKPPRYRLDINGTFLVDLSSYSYSSIVTIEVQIRYRATKAFSEKFYLKAYNWSSGTYTDNGFNNTSGHIPTSDWNYYAVNFTDKWSDYMREDGKLFIKLQDEDPDSHHDPHRTTIDIDFFAVRVVISGIAFSFKNQGALTAHIVSLWIIDANTHNRYDANFYIGAGENATYILGGAELPNGQYTVKAVTERGNIAVYSSS